MTDLQGRVPWATGTIRGIGQGVARRLGELGASVVVNYSSDHEGAARSAPLKKPVRQPSRCART